jgi:hypothetical protein
MAQSTKLSDGTYRVTTATFVAGFVVENGVVVACAPILAKRLSYWMNRAEKVE